MCLCLNTMTLMNKWSKLWISFVLSFQHCSNTVFKNCCLSTLLFFRMQKYQWTVCMHSCTFTLFRLYFYIPLQMPNFEISGSCNCFRTVMSMSKAFFFFKWNCFDSDNLRCPFFTVCSPLCSADTHKKFLCFNLCQSDFGKRGKCVLSPRRSIFKVGLCVLRRMAVGW